MLAKPSSGPGVLLYAATPTARQALSAVLAHGGYRVFAVDGEDEALQALEDGAVDLILVHLRLPDAARLDFVKLQRMGAPADPFLPVIVLADTLSAEVDQACADARVDLRLTSPIEPRALLDYILDLLAKHDRAH